MAKAFKVKVSYRDNAHEDQLIGVMAGSYSHPLKRKIITAQDAEDHCKAVLHHKEHTEGGDVEIFECVDAKAVSPTPMDLAEVPKVVAVKDFIKEQ